ncbi:MAG: type I phosphomannose isomerase catalytic subunit [Gemmatimonadales bacterium]|nr:type I phosphomannose isomerase catalytic subunit [Gemmatimonadales bacterium]
MTAPPLPLLPILLDKVWGGDALRQVGHAVAPGARVGEAWLAADLVSTSASGAGGGAVISTVGGGPWAGRTLRDVMAKDAAALLGASAPAPGGGFPLLVKLLDAREHLSVQVHPSPSYASAHPEAHVKHEAWLVLHAEPGAQLFVGLREGVSPADVAAAVTAGTLPSLLRAIRAVPGECHLLPSGTVHALGAGIVVAEVQTPSDTTFRLYDWTTEYARPPRALHVEASLESLVTAAPPAPVALGAGVTRLATTAAFTLDGRRTTGPTRLDPSSHMTVLLGIGGEGTWDGDDGVALALGEGCALVLPAGAGGTWRAAPGALLLEARAA